jgi:hypothetical protein
MDFRDIQDALLGITFAAIAILRIVRVVNSRKIASAFGALSDGELLLGLIFLSFANAVLALRSDRLLVKLMGSAGCIVFSGAAIRNLRRLRKGQIVEPPAAPPDSG